MDSGPERRPAREHPLERPRSSETLIANRLAQPAQGMADCGGSHRQYPARFTDAAMQHDRVENSEQIEVDHAKVRRLRLDTVSALFGLVFREYFQLWLC